MTREDVKKIFPDATDEQITSFLNQSNSDVAKEKAKAQKVKEQAEKADAGRIQAGFPSRAAESGGRSRRLPPADQGRRDQDPRVGSRQD